MGGHFGYFEVRRQGLTWGCHFSAKLGESESGQMEKVNFAFAMCTFKMFGPRPLLVIVNIFSKEN